MSAAATELLPASQLAPAWGELRLPAGWAALELSPTGLPERLEAFCADEDQPGVAAAIRQAAHRLVADGAAVLLLDTASGLAPPSALDPAALCAQRRARGEAAALGWRGETAILAAVSTQPSGVGGGVALQVKYTILTSLMTLNMELVASPAIDIPATVARAAALLETVQIW
jgi:hypothetical protein